MRKLRLSATLALPAIAAALSLILWAPSLRAQETPEATEVAPIEEPAYVAPTYRYLIGQVEGVSEQVRESAGYRTTTQTVLLRLQGGDESGKLVETESQYDGPVPEIRKGDRVVVVESDDAGEKRYDLGEPYRLPALGWIVGGFFALVIAFGRKKGAMAIAGLFFSILVLQRIVVGGIIAGRDPLTATAIGMAIILFVSLYLAHGANKRTSVAMGGALIAVIAAYVAAKAATAFAGITGTGTEEAIFLQAGPLGTIDLRGLFLSGVMIGAIGVLDDASTAQSAAVAEIAEADPSLPPAELYRRGLAVGREHIASLVNTLVLAYAGASLPLFLLFSIYKDVPAWVILNGGPIAEEIVRTAVGSGALVLAVPVTTWIASRVFATKKDPMLSSPRD